MRWIDLLLDGLNQTTIFEMAHRRRDAVQFALNLSEQIAEHVLKILVFERGGHTQHWHKEINTWLRSIQSKQLKSTGRPLPRQDLMRLLHEGPFEHLGEVKDRIRDAVRNYPNHKIKQSDASVIHQQLASLYSAICSNISLNQFEQVEPLLKDLNIDEG